MKQNGNVLFLILIAVALFAALSYAVTQSTRGGGNADEEKVGLRVAEILQWASSIRSTIQRLQIINGCSDTDISFESPRFSGHVNPTSPVDNSCHVFHPDGGGLSSPDSIAGIAAIDFIGIHCYTGLGSSGCSQGGKELEFNLFDVPLEVCVELNRQLDVGVAGATPSTENYASSSASPFVGTYSATTGGTYIIDTPATNYHSEGCYTDNVGAFSGYHIFYSILIER